MKNLFLLVAFVLASQIAPAADKKCEICLLTIVPPAPDKILVAKIAPGPAICPLAVCEPAALPVKKAIPVPVYDQPIMVGSLPPKVKKLP